MKFIGHHERTVDAQSRITLPRLYAVHISSERFLLARCKTIEGLLGFPVDYMQLLVAEKAKQNSGVAPDLPPIDFAGAHEVRFNGDTTKFTIPRHLRDTLTETQVCFVGCGDRFVICTKTTFETQVRELIANSTMIV